MSNEYEIKHISDILLIPDDKLDHFLIDLKTSVEMAKNMRGITEVLGDVSSLKEFFPKMIWIDDDKHDSSIRIEITEVESKEPTATDLSVNWPSRDFSKEQGK